MCPKSVYVVLSYKKKKAPFAGVFVAPREGDTKNPSIDYYN
jgi:hypothetical protein